MNTQDRRILEQVSSNWLIGSSIIIIGTIFDVYLLVKEIFSGDSIDVDYALKLSLVLVAGILVSWLLVRKSRQTQEDLKKE